MQQPQKVPKGDLVQGWDVYRNALGESGAQPLAERQGLEAEQAPGDISSPFLRLARWQTGPVEYPGSPPAACDLPSSTEQLLGTNKETCHSSETCTPLFNYPLLER